ncbi:MAG: molybdate ABC transporter substrate-binding protein [Alphaproteobacteria bacterium]|nr:molybdate ABC transporter substrate-binding protein [Alphaproteobacteria bacterium]
MKFKSIALAWLAAFALLGAPEPGRAADLTVFAAASLTDALQKVGDAYKSETGKSAAFSFAASSALARQIEASGGADLFMSADSDWMNYLDDRGLVEHATRRNLLSNGLVLIAPANAGVSIAIAPHFDLAGALKGGRLALADPDSVPAGKYARQSLTSLGVWNSVVDHIAGAENVRVALAYVARGEAPLGIVYSTDAKAEPRVKVVGTFPDSTHLPIVYPAAIVKGAKPGAKAFLDYMRSPKAIEIFRNAGFSIVEGQ